MRLLLVGILVNVGIFYTMPVSADTLQEPIVGTGLGSIDDTDTLNELFGTELESTETASAYTLGLETDEGKLP